MRYWRGIGCALASAFCVLGIANAQAPARKAVIAVAEIQDSHATGQAAALKTMIQTAITETGKFRVIERDFGQLDSEQALAKSGRVTTNRPGRSGGYEGIDYLIYGSITSASGARSHDAGAQVGRGFAEKALGISLGGSGGCSKVVATLAVDVKIVDALTGEISSSEQLTQRAASASSCSGDANLDMTSLMRNIANLIAAKVAITKYPIKVAAVQPDGTFVLNYGDAVLQPGTILIVYGAGMPIRDPDTGVVMTSEGAELGRVRVTEANTRFSKALPVAPFVTPPPIGSVARITTETPAAHGNRQKRK